MDRQQSEYNMAVSYLNRLNVLFYTADEAALELNAHSWFLSLIVLSRELSTWMDEEEIKTRKNMIKEIKEAMAIFNKKIKPIPEIPENLFILLDDFEMFVRKILKKSGLQDKMKDDPMFALK